MMSSVALPTLADRRAGVLLHVTSLPGSPYCGDLGPEARAFVDFLAAGGFSWWQMLPVNPTGDGDSPYSTISTFAGEGLLISALDLKAEGYLKAAEIKPESGAKAAGRADYAKARRFRGALLRKAYERWKDDAKAVAAAEAWRKTAGWFDDYALFLALAEGLGTTDFTAWPAAFAQRDPGKLAEARAELKDELNFILFTQHAFARQWEALRAYAHERGVGLIGDLPIFVSCRSADVWAHRGLFHLDEAGRPTVVSGCPPDAFNKDGQLWGTALYDWDALRRTGFRWWVDRLAAMLSLFDVVRLDHFIGFHRYWEIPAKAKTAKSGAWKPAAGAELFEVVRKAFGKSKVPPFIAEDLGAVVPPVRELRDRFGFPGMKVLQFAFDGSDEAREHVPHLVSPNSAMYTGTHDNDTARGWYQTLKKRAAKEKSARVEAERAELYLGLKGPAVHDEMVRTVLQCPSNLVVVPAQDLLGQPSAARMNVPGTATGNWRYRLPPGVLDKKLASRLRQKLGVFDRLPR